MSLMEGAEYVTTQAFAEYKAGQQAIERRAWEAIGENTKTIGQLANSVGQIGQQLTLHLQQVEDDRKHERERRQEDAERERVWRQRVFLITLAAVTALFTGIVSIGLGALQIVPGVIE